MMPLRVTDELVKHLVDSGLCVADGSTTYYEHNTAKLLASGELSASDFKSLSTGSDYLAPGERPKEKKMTTTAEKLFEGRDGRVNVKTASGQYSTKTYTSRNKHGHSVINPLTGAECQTMSEMAAAQAGVMLKFVANKSGVVSCPLDEHEKQILSDLCGQKWAGKIGSDYFDEIPQGRVKALLDDSTSGGLEMTPIAWDNDVISFPLLNGELLPLVDLQNVPRGRRIEGASINTPTMSWGGADASDIPIFSTTSMVAAIDSTVQVVNGCVEIGRDFLSDSPANVGSILTGLVGDRLSTELDRVIAKGNGTTEPTGLFTSSGVTTITADNGPTGPVTVGDLTELLFSLPKQYRRSALNVAYISNDVTYGRTRAMKVDSAGTTDQRMALDPAMNNTLNGYQTLGWKHAVQNDIANNFCGVCAFKKYRLYQRQGLEIRFEQGGKELARANTVLLVFRARYAGKLMDSNAFAKWTNGQS